MEFAKAIDREATKQQPGVKGFLHWWLDNHNNNRLLFVDIILNIIIVVSVAFVIAEYAYGDNLPSLLGQLNVIFLVFFIFEYAIRFFIGTDFLWDAFKRPDGSLTVAIRNKLKWMMRIQSIIDLLAILPVLRYLRILRSLRLLRLLRLLRIVRILKVFRNTEKYFMLFRGLSQNWRVFIVFFFCMGSILSFLSLGIFFFEINANSPNFDTYSEAFWHTFKLVELADDTPSTAGGKLLSSLIMICNIFFISILISLMTVKLEEVMGDVKEGKIGKIKLTNHFVLCGFSRSARLVINELLKDKKNRNNVVLVTQKDDPDINGLIYVHGDFSEEEMLSKVNIGQAEACVIFAEPHEHDDRKTTDLRTIMTVFNIEYEYPHVHTICEINHSENAKIIKSKVKGDEIIFKEIIDADMISTCLRFRNITPLLYDLINTEGKQLVSKTILDLGMESGATFREVKECGIEQDFIALGILRDEQKPLLAPENDLVVNDDDKIIAIGAAD